MPAKCRRQARGQRISGAADDRLPGSVCRRLTIAPRRRAWLGTWRLQSYNRGFCQLQRRSRLRSYTAICLQKTTGHHAQCGRTWHWHVLDGHAQVTNRTGTECAMEDWPRRHGSVQRQMQGRAPRVVCVKATTGTCVSSHWRSIRATPFCCKYGGARARAHRAVQCTLRRLIEQAGGLRKHGALCP